MGNKFKCAQCGRCCTNTLFFKNGNLFGPYLDPSEIDRFPADVIFPLLGRGDPIVVTAYQLGVNRCPNYAEENGVGRCGIYERRPKTCVAFPVIGRLNVTDACPTVRAMRDGIDADSLTRELAAHQEKLDQMLGAPPNEFAWPLNKKCWVPLNETREVVHD